MEPGICQDKQCSAFKIRPPKVFFKFKVNGKKTEKTEFKVTNVSKESQVVNISQPLSEYFSVTPLLAKGYILPGETIKVAVNLNSGLEPRIHYDVVQVNCREECATDVALEAIPKVRSLKCIPRVMNLGHVPLGQKRTKIIKLPSLKRDSPFVLMTRGHHPDLTISPTRGVVRAGGAPAEVSIAYKPTAYITLSAEVSLHLPSVLFNPYVFTVTAFTEPGHARKVLLRQPSGSSMVVNPLHEKAMTHPTWLLKPTKVILPKKTTPLWSQHKSNKILFKQMHEKRQFYLGCMQCALRKNVRQFHLCNSSPYELLGPLGRYLDEEEKITKSKEQGFFQEVNLVHRANTLAYSHTRTKLRSTDSADIDRVTPWKDYLNQYEIPTYNNFGNPMYIRQRTIKRADVETKMHRFTEKLPNIWFPRYVIMSKFIEAGRRVIDKNRLMKVLEKLKKLTPASVIGYETPPAEPF